METILGPLCKLGAAFVLLAALASCATLDEKQCRSVDWRQLGQQDGMNGRPMSYVDKHRQACLRHKLPISESAWRQGWAAGIRSYCTPRNGLAAGSDGRTYARACPADLATGFESAYLVGRQVHDARRDVEQAEFELGALVQQRWGTSGDAERQMLEMRILMQQSAILSAHMRLSAAEAAYRRYLAGLARG